MEENPKHPDVARIFTQLLDTLDMNAAQFARKIGSTPQAVSNYMVGRNEPGRKMLALIIEAYPNIDAAWLATGAGEPFPNGRVRAQLPPPVPSEARPLLRPGQRPATTVMAVLPFTSEEVAVMHTELLAARRELATANQTIERLWGQNTELLKKPGASADTADLFDETDAIWADHCAEQEAKQYRIAAQVAYGAVQGRWVNLSVA